MTITRELAVLFRLVATPGLSQLMVRVNMVGELTITAQNPVTKEKRLILVKDEQDTDLLEHAPLEWYLYTNALVAAVRQGLLRVLTDDEIADDDEELPLIPVVGNPILSPFGANRGDLLTFDGQNWITVAPGIVGQVLTTQGLNNLPEWTTTGAGVGDVVGPAGAPANSIPRFVGTSGKVITSTTVSIDALGRLNLSGARIVNVGAPVDPNDAVNKAYVDGILGPDSWRNAVNAVGVNTPPSSPVIGDRYVVGAAPTGTWIGHANHIAQWDGTNWNYDIAQHGWVTTSLNSDTVHYFNGSTWVNLATLLDHGSLQGLGDDDHTQYLRVDGVRPMSAPLNMGGFGVTNVGLVDGVDVDAHAARHAPGGADALATAAAVGLNASTTNTEGSGNAFARNDHTHAIAVGGATTSIAPNNVAGAGTSNNLVREDHVHAVATAAPVATGTTNDIGSANTLAKSDHVHRTLVGAQKAGVAAGARPAFNFTGAGVTVTEDPTNDRINVDIVTAGAGDVHGPASSVVNTVPKFGDLTGKTLVNSAVVIDANDNIVMGGKKVTDVGAPTVGSDATNKTYVDNAFATLDHGSLQGLGDDDHTQYLRVDGARQMAGDLNMAGYDIYNVDTVDGVDVSDHRSRHLPGGADALATAAAVTLTASTTNTEGTAASFARSDHTHSITANVAASSLSATTTNTVGSSPSVARSDHTHAIPTATAVGLTAASTNTTGTGDNFARATHTHAIATGGATTSIAPNNVAGPGTSNNLVREDHVHAVATAAPVATGTANAAGSANTLAKSDHVHRTEVAVQGAGTAVGSRPTIDFVGPIVTVTDDPLNDKTIVTIVGGTGSGDVTGPAGAAANSVVLFDGTTGKMIKDSPFSLDGTDLSLGGNKLVDVATPTDPTDGTNKAYVDSKVYDHGGLSGLGDDDHTQYLLVSGTRPMGGNLDMGGFSVTNVNLVDGVDVSAHAARHLPGGADALATAAAVGLSATTTNAEGNAVSFARSNHTHAIPTAAAVTLTATTTNAVGSSVNLARSDHTHAITTAAAVGLTAASTNTVGTAASIARSDHTHALSMGTATVAIAPDNVQGGGSNTGLARIDHVHTVTTAAPVATGTANAAGTANSLAKSDHVHRTLVAGAKDGTAVASRPAFNFIGAGVTVADNTVNDRLDVTINANVVGPASVTDNAVVIFDGTTGKLLKESPFRLAGSNLSLENNKLINVATPTAGTDAANKAYVDGHVFDHGGLSGLGDDDHTQYLLVSGVRPMAGDLDMGDFLIHNVGAPVDPEDAANKAYVDALLTSSAPVAVNRTAAVVGVSSTAARSDHKHDIAVAAPVTIGTANAQGVAASLALSDHVHAHGDQAGGTLHAVATTTVDGFLSAADKTKIDSVETGATATPLASTAPVAVSKSTAVVGVSTTAARSDHKHDIDTATAVTIGTANAEGTSTSMARADHVHAHGDQAGGTLHAVASTTVPGFMSETDKTKLDGVAAGATATPLTASAPVNVTKAAAAVGVATDAARSDHKHDIATAVAVALTVGATNAEGTSTSMARADHVHTIAAGTPVAIGAANAAGSATTFVRSDHVHAHGAQAGGTTHADATTSVSGFMSASDKTKLDGVATGATATPLTSTAPVNVTKAAAVVGVATDAARSDHKHDVSTAAPSVGIGAGNSEGTATSLARSDHNHAFRINGVDVTMGAVADGQALSLSGTTIVGLTADGTPPAFKVAVRIATTANITLSAPQTIDGVAVVAGDRVLVKNQTTSSQNGIYVVAAGAWTRATDYDATNEVTSGSAIFVQNGTANINTIWTLSTSNPITVGTTGLTYVLYGVSSVAPQNVTKATASAGTANQAARVDHKHDVTTAAPVAIGTALTEGTSTALARADHIHTHGNQLGGTLHADATTSTSGFMSATDKTKLDGVATGATNTPLTASAPQNVTKAAAVVGVATDAARSDHKHDIATAAPVAIGGALAEGSSTSMARADHVHTHGDQAGGTLHAVATTTVDGFLSAADKTKLDGMLPSDSDQWKQPVRLCSATNITLSGAQNVDAFAVVSGDRILVRGQSIPQQNGIYVASTTGAWTRATDFDSSTDVQTGATVRVNEGANHTNTVWSVTNTGTIVIGTTGLSFTSTGLTSTAPANVTKSAAAVGNSGTAARSDHKHDVVTAAAVDLTDATNGEGTATSLARSDHTHAHGDRAGGTLHAAATTSVNGFMSAADKTKLDGIATGATVGPALTSTAPVNVTKAAAAVGVATDAARSDHKHDISTAAAVALTAGGANAEGTATTMARSDHTHSLPGYGTPVAVGTANAAGSATTFARSDHVHATPFSAVNAALAAANAAVNLNGQELTNIADGFSSPNSAATVGQLNNATASLPLKAYVDVATTANIALGGLTPIDGVAYSANARILVKNQTNATENGIYTASAGAWSRSFDAISTAHFANGVLAYVVQGSINGGSFWACNATRPVSLGTTQIAWTKIVQDDIIKQSVRVSTSTDITLSGLQTIDGINLNAGDRILVRSQVNQVNNGIYVVASGTWTRALDFDTFGGVFGAVYQGTMVRVSEGTLHANTLWAVITANPVSTGSSAIIFSVVGGGDANQPSLVSKSLGLVGSSNFFSRSDHKHDISTAAPVAVGTANSEGTATTMARSDHVHATPFSAVNAALAAANATINVNDQRITGVANAVSGTDAVNLDTLNAATSAAGPSPLKTPVRVATLADTTLSGLYAIDGVTVVAGDRVLVKNQTLPANNGIYVAASGAWTRATDADTSAKFTVGFQVAVREGTNNANTYWHMTTGPTGFTLGTTGITITLLQQKRIGSGTAAPTGGVDGDIYLQYT